MKVCVKCKIQKDTINFSKRKSAKDGLHPYCKECVSGIMKIYGENDLVKKRTKEWKKNNPEKVKIHAKKTYEKNKEKIIDNLKKYNEKNRKKINERQRLYYLKNREIINDKTRAFLKSKEGNIYSNEYYHKNKIRFDIKIKARNKLRYAVRTGKIMKPKKCEKCLMEFDLHAHHENYNFPLTVIWVCSFCHAKLHKKENIICD